MMPDSARPPIGDVRRGRLRGLLRTLVRGALLLLARLLVGLRIEGIHHVPRHGRILVVANHLHNVDPVLLGIAFPRLLLFMAKQELFAERVLALVMRIAGAFPVDRGKADRSAIRFAEAALTQGQAVAIFPEGTRSLSGKLGPGQAGVGLIALRSEVPILPVAITGTETLPGNGQRHTGTPRRHEVRIRFGAPFRLPPPTSGQRTSSQDATDRIMAAIADVLPAAYR